MNLVASRMTLTEELGEAEYEMREAISEIEKAQRRLRKANGWYHEILRILEEEDKHG